jgi:hypothetical protein
MQRRTTEAMKIRTFDALTGRKITLESEDGLQSYRFVLESIFAGIAVMGPADKRAMAFARELAPKTPLRVVASVDDGILSAGAEVEKWSERAGTLRILRPRVMDFAQRRRTVRLPARMGIELSVLRDGRMVSIHGRTEDISIGGFAATIDESIEPGEPVVALIHLPGESVVVTAQVTVVEALRRRLMHARTTAISPDDYAVLAASLRVIEADLEKQGVRI